MVYLPNATYIDLGPDGGFYDNMSNPKVCWHTTEGTTLAGAEQAFKNYPPHLGYNPLTRELHQYVPLNRHSYAFFNSEADDEYVIQIEVVGFASQSHLWPDWVISNIVNDLVNPLEAAIGVPPIVVWTGFHGEGEGFILASPSSPIRISLSQLREFSGHLGHQHIPGDSHWDPGRFPIDKILKMSTPPSGGGGTKPKRKSEKMNGIGLEVTSGEAPGIRVGSAFIIDFTNQRSMWTNKEGLATAFKEAGVPHLGVSAGEARNWLDTYNAGPAVVVPPVAK